MNQTYIGYCLFFLLASNFCSMVATFDGVKDKICIEDSSDAELNNAMYEWSYWDRNFNGSVYKQSNTILDRYLYPFITSWDGYTYKIGDNTSISTAFWAHCPIDNPLTGYIFNINDCIRKWYTWSNDSLVEDPNMIVTYCQDICITGNRDESIDGTYVFNHFDHTTNSTVYYCESCNSTKKPYLYLYITRDDDYYWYISSNYTNIGTFDCYLGTNPDSTNLNNCVSKWEFYNGTDWISYNITVQKCNYPPVISTTNPSSKTNYYESIMGNLYYRIAVGIVVTFLIICCISLFDAKCWCRRNDYFCSTALYVASLQILDIVSDLFFLSEVVTQYINTPNKDNIHKIQFLLISILSTIFIVVPIIISLGQLQHASSKHWLYDNRTREWLLSYSNLLYFVSVFTGSSFTAVEIFNSNLFGLDIFYMDLPKHYLLSFTTKKIYSIILFENCPQLVLSVWYIVILERPEIIPIAAIIFSLISIIVTIISMILHKQIYKTQDYVHIVMDITGEDVMSNMKFCKNRMKNIKLYLCQSVLGVNEKSVQFQKPFSGSARKGVQLQIYISYIHDKANINPADNYEDLLNIATDNGMLHKVIQEEWRLSNEPEIGNLLCKFIRSKEKKQLSIIQKL